MKARYAYPLLFLVPGAMLAAIAAVLAGAACVGVLWIFVYGDNPWPASVNTVVMGFAAAVGIAVLAVVLLVAQRVGKSRESRGGLHRTHVLIALSLSVALPLLALFHQWQVGNISGVQVPPSKSSMPKPLRGPA